MIVDPPDLMTENKLRHIERLLSDGRYRNVESIMANADADAWPSSALVAVASITFHAKPYFTAGVREAFLERVLLTLTRRLGAVRAEALIKDRR